MSKCVKYSWNKYIVVGPDPYKDTSCRASHTQTEWLNDNYSSGKMLIKKNERRARDVASVTPRGNVSRWRKVSKGSSL